MSTSIKLFIKELLGFAFFNFYYRFTKKAGNRVLLYHAFGTDLAHDSYGISISLDDFEKHLQYLNSNEHVVSLTDVYEKELYSGENTVSITIDDGYKDNLSAIELFEKYNFPYTIYIATGFIGKEGYLSEEDISKISRSPLCTIGSHTVNHIPLSTLSLQEQEREIRSSKQTLEAIIGQEVLNFSFPHGDYNLSGKKLVDELYTFVATSHYGINSEPNKKIIKRVEIIASDNVSKLKKKISGVYDYLGLMK